MSKNVFKLVSDLFLKSYVRESQNLQRYFKGVIEKSATAFILVASLKFTLVGELS